MTRRRTQAHASYLAAVEEFLFSISDLLCVSLVLRAECPRFSPTKHTHSGRPFSVVLTSLAHTLSLSPSPSRFFSSRLSPLPLFSIYIYRFFSSCPVRNVLFIFGPLFLCYIPCSLLFGFYRFDSSFPSALSAVPSVVSLSTICALSLSLFAAQFWDCLYCHIDANTATTRRQ